MHTFSRTLPGENFSQNFSYNFLEFLYNFFTFFIRIGTFLRKSMSFPYMLIMKYHKKFLRFFVNIISDEMLESKC